MIRLFKFSLIILLATPVAFARDLTQPPSIALRTETSFVNESTLIEKKYIETNIWQLKFKLLTDLHNNAPAEIIIPVSRALAQSLEIDVNYIMAYHTHRKTKVEGLVKYQALPNGPSLLKVQGANPALFRSNELLLKRLQTKPQSDPDLLIKSLTVGLAQKDPKIQEFYVRELINWVGLHDHLTAENFDQLFDVFNSSNATHGTLTALLENRIAFHQSIGVKRMGEKVIKILDVLPVHMDPNSELPTLTLEALNFSKIHAIGNWNIYSRWIRSNIPSVTERALLELHKINPKQTLKLVKTRIKDTQLSDSSRRVLSRYLGNKNNE